MVSVAVLCDGLIGRLSILQIMTCKGCTGALYTVFDSDSDSANADLNANANLIATANANPNATATVTVLANASKPMPPQMHVIIIFKSHSTQTRFD